MSVWFYRDHRSIDTWISDWTGHVKSVLLIGGRSQGSDVSFSGFFHRHVKSVPDLVGMELESQTDWIRIDSVIIVFIFVIIF
jgi:hypothetical protein